MIIIAVVIIIAIMTVIAVVTVIAIIIVLFMRIAAVWVIRCCSCAPQPEKHNQRKDQPNDCSLYRVHFFWRWFCGHDARLAAGVSRQPAAARLLNPDSGW